MGPRNDDTEGGTLLEQGVIRYDDYGSTTGGSSENAQRVDRTQPPIGSSSTEFVKIGVLLAAAVAVVAGAVTIARRNRETPRNLFESLSPSLAMKTEVPFSKVDRGDFGDLVDGFVNLDLFHPSLLSDRKSSDSSEPESTFSFPFPTGAFWTNFVVVSPDGRTSYPVAVYPYAYKWSDSGVQFSYPYNHRLERRLYITDPFVPDLSFGSGEDVSQRYITRFDPVSINLRFLASSKASWDVILVQGSPYATLSYENITPTIRALSIFQSVRCPNDATGDEVGVGRRKLLGDCVAQVSHWYISPLFSKPYHSNISLRVPSV